MLNVVLETNVFVSSLCVRQDLPAQVLDAWRERRYVLAISRAIIADVSPCGVGSLPGLAHPLL